MEVLYLHANTNSGFQNASDSTILKKNADGFADSLNSSFNAVSKNPFKSKQTQHENLFT